jgi:hypothetical protein
MKENNSNCFTVSLDAYPSVFKLAIFILKNRIDNSLLNKNIIKTIRSSVLDKNTPMSFYGYLCNTYIVKNNEHYIVNTNNDIDCDIEGVLNAECCENIETKYEFWFPEYGLIGSIYKDNNKNYISCHEHKNIYFIKIKNNNEDLIVCPSCYWNELVRFKKNSNNEEKIGLLKNAIKNIDDSLLIKLIESKTGQSFWKELKYRLED